MAKARLGEESNMDMDKSLSGVIGLVFAMVMIGFIAGMAKAASLFSVSNLVINPTTAPLGQAVVISCTVTNTGSQAGSYTVKLSGDFIAEQTVSLNPGESTIVSFSVTPIIAKIYSILVDGLSGSFEITSVIPTIYTCPICGATFATYDELYQHFITEHPSTPIEIIWE